MDPVPPRFSVVATENMRQARGNVLEVLGSLGIPVDQEGPAGTHTVKLS